MRNQFLTLTFLTSIIAFGQTAELGVTAGAGAFRGPVAAGQFGAEACVFCAHSFALFGDYTHLFSSASGDRSTSTPSDMELAGLGLRIQSRNRALRARPFYDIGVLRGQDQGDGRWYMVHGVGIRLALGQRWYIRPRIRFYLGSPHAAAIGSIGIGYQF